MFSERLERLSLLIEKIAALFLALITVIVFVSAIGRYVFAAPIPDGFDIARLMLGVAILWGFASVGYRGSHIKVDLIADLLPRRLRRWLDIVAWLLLLGFTILLAWKLFERADSAYLSNESSFDLRLPVWPFMLVMWLGVVASVITILARIVLLLTDQRSSLEHFESLDQSETAEEQNDPS